MKENIGKLSKVIFVYFNTFISQYPAIEQNWLATNLTTINSSQTSAMETVRTLGNANRKMIEWAEEALKRCENITQNCGIVALTTVLNVSFYKTIFDVFDSSEVLYQFAKMGSVVSQISTIMWSGMEFKKGCILPLSVNLKTIHRKIQKGPTTTKRKS